MLETLVPIDIIYAFGVLHLWNKMIIKVIAIKALGRDAALGVFNKLVKGQNWALLFQPLTPVIRAKQPTPRISYYGELVI